MLRKLLGFPRRAFSTLSMYQPKRVFSSSCRATTDSSVERPCNSACDPLNAPTRPRKEVRSAATCWLLFAGTLYCSLNHALSPSLGLNPSEATTKSEWAASRAALALGTPK